MSSKIVVDAIESNSASTPAITLDSSGTGVYKATSVETSNIKHASSSSNNIVLASDGSVKTNQVGHTANGASVFTLPQTDGSANHVLKTNGYGALSFGAAGNGNSLQVLEQFFSPCDGSVMATNKGNITLGDVTSAQPLDNTITLITGSSLTYEPPAGTVQIIYEFVMHTSFYNANPVGSVYAYLDSTEITDAFTAFAGSYRDDRLSWKWGFNIGGSDNNATGRRANWTGGRTIELKAREYGSSNQALVHTTSYSANTGTDVFVRPCIGITAIGVPA